jgi:phytoene synthase
VTIAAGKIEKALASHGAETIAKGSKSFAIASLLFGRRMQADVHMLYAWCRHCDDVIDGQDLGGDAPDRTLTSEEMQRRLDELRDKSKLALSGEQTGDEAFDGFSIVARRHAMPEKYPIDLLSGFANDVEKRRFESLNDLMEYCYGVAGVVGIMMAIVMGVDKNNEEILDRACDLGLAFQLTNICRDVVDDARGGRVYLPADWLAAEGVAAEPEAIIDERNREAVSIVVAKTLEMADEYYASASEGARHLPVRAAAAVLAARNVYRDIGRKVAERGVKAWDRRMVISTPRKLMLAISGAGAGIYQAAVRRAHPLRPRKNLWRREFMERAS